MKFNEKSVLNYYPLTLSGAEETQATAVFDESKIKAVNLKRDARCSWPT